MPKSRRARSFEGEHGQTMTEFAIVLPLLALLLFGVIQFGILFNNYVTLTDAVRAGARKAAVGRHLPDPAAATEAAVRDSAQDLDQAELDVDITATWEAGTDATVEATYPYKIDLLGFAFAEGTLESKTTERVE